MEEFYDVCALKIEDTTLDLRLNLIMPTDEPVPQERGFALYLLCDAITPRHAQTPLGRRMADYDTSFGFVIDQRFSEFIESIEHRGHSSTYPPPPSYTEEGMLFWEDRGNSVWVELRIKVTDPAWIAHIEPRMRWHSDACESGMIDS